MDKKRHILIVASWYPSQENPTEAPFIQEQAVMLIRAGHNVTILVPRLSGSFRDFVRGNNVPSGNFDNGITSLTQISQTVYLPGMRKFFIQQLHKKVNTWFQEYILKNGKPDIIHSHAAFMGAVTGSFLSKTFHIPHIHTEHTSGLIFRSEQYSKNDVRLIRKAYLTSQKNICVSSFFENKLINEYKLEKENWVTIPNMVQNNFFDKKNEHSLGDDLRFLCAGNFIPVKNQSLLIQAWKIVNTKHPNWRLILAGDGEQKSKCIALAEQSGIKDSIKWLPRLNRDEVAKQISTANCIVSSSKLETFGLTLAEAMAMGKPVVATDSGGPSDFINDENGIIVPNDNENKLAEAIIYVGEHLPEYNANKIRDYAKSNFSEEVILEKLHQVYASALLQYSL